MPWIVGYLAIGIFISAGMERIGYFEASHRRGSRREEVTDCERASLAPRRPCENWRCDFCYQRHYNKNLRKPTLWQPAQVPNA